MTQPWHPTPAHDQADARQAGAAAAARPGAGQGLADPPQVALGYAPTPLWPRLQALSTTQQWVGWGGWLSPSTLDRVEPEYFTLRNQAALFDISPMTKLRVRGPDALAVLNRLVTRDLSRVPPGRVAYALWCDEDGFVIDDGTVFHLGPDDLRLCCQEHQAGWLAEIAWGFDVTITEETAAVAGLALQGPTAFSVLAAAGWPQLAALRPFDLMEVEPGLVVSRTGFTGDLGYELWMPAERAVALWDRLIEAGETWGLAPIGYEAMNIARLEAGFILAGTDYTPIHRAQRPSRGRTPYELGFGRLVHLGKGHFNGRRALAQHAARGPRMRLVGLDIQGNRPAGGAILYHGRRREVGFVTTGLWSPTAKRNIALAELRAPHGAQLGETLWAEIYTNKEGKWDRVMARASVVPRNFLTLARARATPPAPC